MSEFVTTKMLHGVGCEKCQRAAEESRVMATCTGSVGGTTEYHFIDASGEQTLEHSATVKRV